jgi:hypothetical protein
MARSIHEVELAVEVDGKVKRIPAIDAHWAKPVLDLPPFLPPDDGMQAMQWSAAATVVEASLRKVLRSPMHVFWSYMVHDASVISFIDTFLRFARRELALCADDGDYVAAPSDADRRLHECVLLTLVRLTTPRESEAEFLEVQQWRALVYDNWLLDAPKLLDAVAVFGWSNPELTRGILSSALDNEPRYADDLSEALTAWAEAVCQCCGCDPLAVAKGGGGGGGGQLEVWHLPFPPMVEQAASPDPEASLRLSRWVLDAAASLHALLHVTDAQLMRRVLQRCDGGGVLGPCGLLTAAQYTAEAAIPCLRAAVPRETDTGAESHRALRDASAHMLRAAHLLLDHMLIDPLRPSATPTAGLAPSAAAPARAHALLDPLRLPPTPPAGHAASAGPPVRALSSASAARLWDGLIAALEQLADPRARLALTADLYARAAVPLEPVARRAGGGGLRAGVLRGGAGSLLQQLLRVCGLERELLSLARECEARTGAAATAQARRIRELARPVQIVKGAAPSRVPRTAAAVAPPRPTPAPTPPPPAAGGSGEADSAAALQVREMLPDADPDLVLAALAFYHGDVGAVVSALLEPDSLPQALRTDGSAPPPAPPQARPAPAAPAGASAFARAPPRPALQPLGLRKPVPQKEARLTLSAAPRPAATDEDGLAVGMDDDEMDDSFELLSSGPGIRAIDESADDMEASAAAWTRRHIKAEMNGEGAAEGSGAAGGGGVDGAAGGTSAAPGGALPHTALEWLRAIGLAQYEGAMRAHGMVRLQLAAALTEEDCARLKVAPRHKEKLLASAGLLAKRLEARGRKIPRGGHAAVDTSGYAAAQALHYDEETGEFWHEAGELGPVDEAEAAQPTRSEGGRAPGAGTSRPPLTSGRGRGAAGGGGMSKEQLARQRDRKEQNKAKTANHNRKAQAARKHREL